MSSRHEAGRGRAGPCGAHQLQALGSSRGSGVLHLLPHGHVQSNPNPSGACRMSPGSPHLSCWWCGAQVLCWPCLPGGRFSPRAVCRLLSCLLTGRGRCVSTAGELAFAMWAPRAGVAAPLSAAGLQLRSRHRAPCKAWAGVPCASGMKSHPASSPLEGAGGGAAGVTFREAAGALAGCSLSAPTPAHAAPQGSGDRDALPRGSRPVSAAPGTRSTRGTCHGRLRAQPVALPALLASGQDNAAPPDSGWQLWSPRCPLLPELKE